MSYVVCKICGKKLKRMSNHLTTHNLSIGEYKKMFPNTKTITDEVSKKLSEGHKGKVSWCKGLTKETDERIKASAKKMSLSKKGKTFEEIFGSKERADEEKRKRSVKRKGKRPHNKYDSVSKKLTGRPKSPVHRKRLSIAKTGWNPSEKTRAKQGEATRKRWEEIKSDPKLYKEYIERFSAKFRKSFAQHEKLVWKQKEILEGQGFKVIPIHAKVPRPDLIAIKNGKVFAVEIEVSNSPRPEYDKYNEYPFYDDIIWVLKRRTKRLRTLLEVFGEI